MMLSVKPYYKPAALKARIAGMAAFQDALAEVLVEYCDRRPSTALANAISDASETRDDATMDWLTSDILDQVLVSLQEVAETPPYSQVDRTVFGCMVRMALIEIEARFSGGEGC